LVFFKLDERLSAGFGRTKQPEIRPRLLNLSESCILIAMKNASCVCHRSRFIEKRKGITI
jgi:hypothetical protein